MRFDIVSVFPEFFSILNLSLLGKAQKRGILEISSHDLRDWTDDPHRTVDDTPAGGGAGMVMRPDIWGKALDSLIAGDSGRTVLAIPTPSGIPLTQRTCEDLATADHIVICCGRYEGIDSRVAAAYAEHGIEVLEYSLGDYVLNGGEVAAVALIEAVGRLLPGMVGNPESLVEESHGAAGLLEYPVYTRPNEWRGHEIPEVLTSGNHGAVTRWRRDRALEKTAARRPDMISALNTESLDKKDCKKLSELGYLVTSDATHPVQAVAREAVGSDVVELAALAARTFPDACPDYVTEADQQVFIAEQLSETKFAEYVASSDAIVVVLEVAGKLVGYSLTKLPEGPADVAGVGRGAPVDAIVPDHPRNGPMLELSKFYLDRALRGTGARAILWNATLESLRAATDAPEPYVWLATNIANRRAQKAYAAQGFVYAGKRHFMVGEQDNVDRMYVRAIRVA